MCSGEGMIEIGGCPRTFIGRQLTKAINIASLCGNGVLPVHGGLMDQSAWFVSLWQALQAEQSQIDAEIAERWRDG